MLFNNGCGVLYIFSSFGISSDTKKKKKNVAPVRIYREVQSRNIHKAELTNVI